MSIKIELNAMYKLAATDDLNRLDKIGIIVNSGISNIGAEYTAMLMIMFDIPYQTPKAFYHRHAIVYYRQIRAVRRMLDHYRKLTREAGLVLQWGQRAKESLEWIYLNLDDGGKIDLDLLPEWKDAKKQRIFLDIFNQVFYDQVNRKLDREESDEYGS